MSGRRSASTRMGTYPSSTSAAILPFPHVFSIARHWRLHVATMLRRIGLSSVIALWNAAGPHSFQSILPAVDGAGPVFADGEGGADLRAFEGGAPGRCGA